jgi:ParB family chromosome partitioning protein
MAKKNVLGKGMAALLSSNAQGATDVQVSDSKKVQQTGKQLATNDEGTRLPSIIDIDSLEVNLKQPRKIFNDKEIDDLAASLKENGIIQPLVVSFNEENKKFEIIAGERRYRAAKKIGLKKVPIVVKKVTEKDKLAMAIIENVQRVNLNCVEEALAYFQLMEEFKLTQEDVAKKIGKDRSTIANFLRILRLPKEVIIHLQNDKISFGHAKILAAIKDEQLTIRLANAAVAELYSVRELEKKIKEFQAQKPAEHHTIEKKFDEEIDLIKRKLEKKTGFHFAIKKNVKNRGMINIKFNNEAELNDVISYLLR